jgi:hypothetical protein
MVKQKSAKITLAFWYCYLNIKAGMLISSVRAANRPVGYYVASTRCSLYSPGQVPVFCKVLQGLPLYALQNQQKNGHPVRGGTAAIGAATKPAYGAQGGIHKTLFLWYVMV